MANDLARLAGRIAHLERLISQQSRTSQLAYSSIEDGAVEVYDVDGSLRAVIGQQLDGTSGVVAVNGPRPPTPSAPQAEPILGGLRITWDGAFADADAVAPLDLSRVQVHLLTGEDTEPDVMWPAATIEAASGASVTIATNYYDDIWVRLVAVNTSGIPSTASAATRTAARRAAAGDVGNGAIQEGHIAVGAIVTPHLAVGAVTPDQIAVGQGTNLIPDPGFESAATANTIAAAGAPWALAPGNRTGVGVLCDCTADTATYFTLPLATVPVLPGQQFALGTDLLVSEDLAAQAVKILARYESAAGTVLGYGVVEAVSPEPGRWQRISGQVAAPQGATQAVVCLEASEATRGWVVFDNAEATAIFGRVTGGARAEVGPQGVRLYDETGEEAVSLVTGEPQYLTLRNGGTAVATIDDQGNAAFADVSVAGGLTVGGQPISAFLGDRPRGLLAIDYQAASVTGGTSEIGFVELAFEAETDRMYRVVFDAIADPSAAGGEIQIRLRDGKTGKPTVSSPQLQLATYPMPLATSQKVRLEAVRNGGGFGAGLHRLLITFRCAGGPSGQTVDLYGSSTALGVLYVEDIGPHVPETGGYNTGGGSEPDPVRQYTKTYTASWSGSYANRSGYNSYYGAKCMQGYYSSNNGVQASLIGFPAALGTDLAGATIQKAEIYLYAEHWYYASGGSAVIKAHSHTSRPAKFSSDSEAKTVSWRRNEGKWVDITSVFDSTRWRGVALDPNSTNKTYYGAFRGAGQTYPPKLRVTYTK
ncbi:hypothetical protein [Streptomyces sp. NPDC052535]|uniref:hypothetical protein n=1 Tax=Streptomyces sp. NPDC052535 TaxID=3155531 RepID=UPI00344507F3